MSLKTIQSAIPHRDPFLLIDTVVEQDGNRIICQKTLSGDEFWFAGHYPEFPLMPGVLLCEAAMQAGAVLLSAHADGKGVPVLVKHYLKLRGSFVGFAVDRSFGNSLDGLIVVDLRNMDDKQLLNYFGNEGLNRMIKARKERGEQTGTPFQTHESE